MSPQARALLASDLAQRYAMPGYTSPFGDTGDAYRGTRYTVQVEALADGPPVRCSPRPTRPSSPCRVTSRGSSFSGPRAAGGDLVMVVHTGHDGYDGYMPGFLPDQIGVRVAFLPFDEASWNVDVDAAADAIAAARPRLVWLGASHLLFPYDLGRLRAACDDVNAILGYDGSHILGLAAGGAFQQPMAEGADVVSASTHKSFPGPQGGLLLASRADVF